MKNHVKVNGQLLQTNKKWSHLKQKQVQYIYDKTVELHTKFVAEHEKLPRKQYKNDIINGVYDELNMHIPYSEARPHISKYIDRLNRKLEKQNNEYLQN